MFTVKNCNKSSLHLYLKFLLCVGIPYISGSKSVIKTWAFGSVHIEVHGVAMVVRFNSSNKRKRMSKENGLVNLSCMLMQTSNACILF